MSKSTANKKSDPRRDHVRRRDAGTAANAAQQTQRQTAQADQAAGQPNRAVVHIPFEVIHELARREATRLMESFSASTTHAYVGESGQDQVVATRDSAAQIDERKTPPIEEALTSIEALLVDCHLAQGKLQSRIRTILELEKVSNAQADGETEPQPTERPMVHRLGAIARGLDVLLGNICNTRDRVLL